MNTTTFNDVLIEEVKKREVLWNRWHENYNHRLSVDREWESLCKTLGRDKEKLKQKWRNLRDQYQRELKKVAKTPDGDLEPYAGRWIFFHQMSFLKDVLLPRIKRSSEVQTWYNHATGTQDGQENEGTGDDPSSDASDYVPGSPNHDLMFKIEPQIEEPRTSTQKIRKRKADLEDPLSENEPSSAVMTRDFDSDIDDDLCFVKSLVPFLRRLNPVRKLIVRNEMQSLLIKELLCERCLSKGPNGKCSCAS